MTIGAALGMLYDRVLAEVGLYGTVMRRPSPTGETWIGWEGEGRSAEAGIKLPITPERASEAADRIVEQLRE